MNQFTLKSFDEFAGLVANLPFKSLFRGESRLYPRIAAMKGW